MPIRPGGIMYGAAVFFGIIIVGALVEITVIDEAVRPLLAFAKNMDFQSSASQTGLDWLTDWVNILTFIFLILATFAFLSQTVFDSRGL